MTQKELKEKIAALENSELRNILNEITLLDTQTLSEKKDEIIKELEEIVKKYPLMSLLVAALIGFILAKVTK